MCTTAADAGLLLWHGRVVLGGARRGATCTEIGVRRFALGPEDDDARAEAEDEVVVAERRHLGEPASRAARSTRVTAILWMVAVVC
jgi:hypothetical protein